MAIVPLAIDLQLDKSDLFPGLPLFSNFWKPRNIREFCKGQGKGTESGISHGNFGKVREFV